MSRPLVTKLGIKEGHLVCLVQPPDAFFDVIEGWPEGVEPLSVDSVLEIPPDMPFDVVHCFSMFAGHLAGELPGLLERVPEKGMLWISWPKKSSGFSTDIDANVVRKIVRAAGMIDVKVCSIDEVWTACKFVWRKT